MLTKIKQKVQQMLVSEASAAHRIGLTPNTVTAIGFLLASCGAIVYVLASVNQPQWLVGAVILLLASGFCDTLDGILARTFNQATKFGGFLDSLLDRYADVFVFAAIIINTGLQVNVALSLTALASSFMVSYSRARAEAAGVKMESVGIAERAERMIILAVASIAAVFWLPALSIGVGAIAVLATFTVFQRSWHAYQALEKQKLPVAK
jgi:archaetidylinositol phosphate synthase